MTKRPNIEQIKKERDYHLGVYRQIREQGTGGGLIAIRHRAFVEAYSWVIGDHPVELDVI